MFPVGPRARGPRFAASPPSARSRAVTPPSLPARHSPSAAFAPTAMAAMLACSLSLAPEAVAQATPNLAPGYTARRHFAAQSLVPFVRRVLVARTGKTFVAITNQVFVTQLTLPAGQMPRLRLPNEDVAFLAEERGAGGRVLAGGLRTGLVRCLDANSGQLLATYPGVANAFDAEPLANGDLLLSANPNWPAGGSNSGLWLAGPGRTPRLLLQLSGPSGPLVVLGNGDLVVGELGPIVPPPPGAARLLRFPAAAVQQALAGGTLTTAQAAMTGNGFGGIYDLAADDEGRMLVSDPASPLVVHTAPGGLTPVGTWFDAGPGRFVTSLQRQDRGNAPLAAFQPYEHAPSVLATTTDYTSQLEVFACGPQRPLAALNPSPFVAVGTSTHAVRAAPPLGVGLVLASLQPLQPEQAIAWFGGTPLWLGLDASSAVPFAGFALDAQGRASVPIVNPGGFAADLHFQTVVFAPGSGAVASTSPLTAHLLP